MEALEILLILIGIIVVAASFLFADRLSDTPKEDEDVEAHKEALKEEMSRIFDEYVQSGRGQMEEASKELLDTYVENARREIEVALNEAREDVKALLEETKEQMAAYVTQTQEETTGLTEETKQSLEEIVARQQQRAQLCSDEVIKEINNHHNEVTLLYSMINSKQEEMQNEARSVEQTRVEVQKLAEEVGQVKKEAEAVKESAGDLRERFLKEVKEELLQELMPEVEAAVLAAQPKIETVSVREDKTNAESSAEKSTKTIDSGEIKEVLETLRQQEEESAAENVMKTAVKQSATESEADTKQNDAMAEEEEASQTDIMTEELAELMDLSEKAVQAAVDEVLVEQEAKQINDTETTRTINSEEIKELLRQEEGETTDVSGDQEEEMDWDEIPVEKPEQILTPEECAAERAQKETAQEEKASEEQADKEGQGQIQAEEPQVEEEPKTEPKASRYPTTRTYVVSSNQPDKKEALAQKEQQKILQDMVLEDAPNKLLQVVRESKTVSTEADLEMRKQVLLMYEMGSSSMEIAEALQLGIGEVRMIIDLYSRRER